MRKILLFSIVIVCFFSLAINAQDKKENSKNQLIPFIQNVQNNVVPSTYYGIDAVSGYTFSQASGTYTAITGGTALPMTDDATLGPFTIPSFMFDGVAYTSIYINTNGFLTLGSTAPTGTTYGPISSTTAYSGCIAPFGRDLNVSTMSGAAPEIRYETVGSEFVVQWKDIAEYSYGASLMLNFQVRMNTSTGTIKLVYGPSTVGTASTLLPQVGLRGATNADFNNRTGSWAASTAGTLNTSGMNFSAADYPANGLTYTFTPPVAYTNDVGTLSIDVANPTPPGTVSPKATIRNYGTAPQTFNVTMVISPGGYTNTQVVTSLAASTNIQVTFANWSATGGSKQIKVYTSLASDQNLANDTLYKNVSIVTVLYNQNVTSSGSGMASQEFPDFANAQLESADDFIVPVGQTWTLTDLAATGTWSVAGPMTSLRVNIFQDSSNAGITPGALFYKDSLIIPSTALSNAVPIFSLHTPCVLPAGRYWLSIMIVAPFGTNGQWYWSTTATVGGLCKLRDKANLLAQGYTNWTVLATAPNQSHMFALYSAFPITGISNNNNDIPNSYSMSQNYPNPFNPVTKINFSMPKSGFVTLKIYDVLGREVSSLVNEVRAAGKYSVDFNASQYTSGVYFYKMETNGFSDIKRMMLIK